MLRILPMPVAQYKIDGRDLFTSGQMQNYAIDCQEAAKEEALAQPEQEPVVHPVVHLWDCICKWASMIANDGKNANLSPPDWLVDAVKAATAPPKREWVGLTDEESQELLVKAAHHKDPEYCTAPEMAVEFGRLASELLKEKNSG